MTSYFICNVINDSQYYIIQLAPTHTLFTKREFIVVKIPCSPTSEEDKALAYDAQTYLLRKITGTYGPVMYHVKHSAE